MNKNNRIFFGTRSLLALAFALVLIGRLPAGNDEAKAEKTIKALGGKMFRNGMVKGKPIVRVDLQGTEITDSGLKELAGLNSLRILDLSSTKVTDAGLKELAGLESLHTLSLSSTQVTDAGLKELAGLMSLQHLGLSGTKVMGAGLKELAGLDHLHFLDLSGTKVTGAGLKELAGLKSLQRLNLSGAKVTDAGLKELAGLKSLRHLDLSGMKVTGAAAAELEKALPTCDIIYTVEDIDANTIAAFQKLGAEYGSIDLFKIGLGFYKRQKPSHHGYPAFLMKKELQAKLPFVAVPFGLQVVAGPMTDAGLKNLAGQKNLIWLNLMGKDGDSYSASGVTDTTLRTLREIGLLHALSTASKDPWGHERPRSAEVVFHLQLYSSQVTDAGLTELVEFKNLQTLRLGGTKVTKEGVAELQKALPKCNIQR